MLKFKLLIVLLYVTYAGFAFGRFITVKSKLHNIVFKYYKQSNSEKALPICESRAVCSLLHRRYWLPPVAVRLCRCATGLECPWQWSEPQDSQSMALDNRSQLKFCEPMKHLDNCQPKKTALILRTYRKGDQQLPIPPTVTVSCHCPEKSYWRQNRRYEQTYGLNTTVKVTDTYKCVPLKRCKSQEFCGHARSDYSSIYYRCSCPYNHYCMYTDKTLYSKIEELMFRGGGYMAYCEPKSFDNEVDYDY